jgi:hypothetical protein
LAEHWVEQTACRLVARKVEQTADESGRWTVAC